MATNQRSSAEDPGEVVTDEQRRANVLKLRKLVWDIKDRRTKGSTLKWKQYHNPRDLLRALDTFREDD